NLLTAQVFSDPPMNTVPIAKQGNRLVLDEKTAWSPSAHYETLGDGAYLVGLRSHHVLLQPDPGHEETDSVALDGTVMITELSGSESTVHFSHGEQTWISQSHGIHALEIGQTARFRFNPRHALLFSTDGQRISGGADGGLN
ncbi:MAG: TOBE domain-containing protein, partial [Pseudomonadota bacterium]